ncbi:hypothetical protein [Paenibacillus sp. FSL L8-0709]|uniref:hypothetical protein n=1 Tax=Paenibacillus sp. FSL L8-0709 TaxID=2975312 RepID=UPI0030FABADE
MSEIHVGLYGGKGLFGGKETPLEASLINCDKHDKCSYFQSGTCLAVRSFGGGRCQFGRVSNITGYTRRAKKYSEFSSKWKEHEAYGKLKSPPKKLGIIGDYVVYPYAYAALEVEDDSVLITNPGFFNEKNVFIPKKLFNVNLIRRLCVFQPQAIMGGTITDYQKKEVPLFLAHLKEVLPELYVEFTAAYPGYREIDYIGRKALLKTVAPSRVKYESRQYPQFNAEWEWTGDHLVYKKGFVSDFNITKGYSVASIVLEPGETSTITITNNEQVTEETLFVD